MSFDLSEYVDVAERIRIFREKYPEGSLQSEVTIVNETVANGGFYLGVLCRAWAYRSGDDPRPGIGHSFLEIPGKTPYTKDSEVENAETSAWGRAIVAALAADTKKVASADEVRAKHDGNQAPAAAAQAQATQPAANGWTWPFGKHKGLTLENTPGEYLDWFLENSDKEDIKERIRAFRGVPVAVGDVDSDIPFMPSVDGLGG